MKDDENFNWISINDAAKKIGVHRNTISKWIKVGFIESATNISGRWLISVDEARKIRQHRIDAIKYAGEGF